EGRLKNLRAVLDGGRWHRAGPFDAGQLGYLVSRWQEHFLSRLGFLLHIRRTDYSTSDPDRPGFPYGRQRHLCRERRRRYVGCSHPNEHHKQSRDDRKGSRLVTRWGKDHLHKRPSW